MDFLFFTSFLKKKDVKSFQWELNPPPYAYEAYALTK